MAKAMMLVFLHRLITTYRSHDLIFFFSVSLNYTKKKYMSFAAKTFVGTEQNSSGDVKPTNIRPKGHPKKIYIGRERFGRESLFFIFMIVI